MYGLTRDGENIGEHIRTKKRHQSPIICQNETRIVAPAHARPTQTLCHCSVEDNEIVLCDYDNAEHEHRTNTHTHTHVRTNNASGAVLYRRGHRANFRQMRYVWNVNKRNRTAGQNHRLAIVLRAMATRRYLIALHVDLFSPGGALRDRTC